MKRLVWLLLALTLVSCQPQTAQTTVYLLDGDQVLSLQADSNTPASILAQAGVTLSPADKIYFNGVDLPVDLSLPPGGPYTLQIRRAHTLTLVTPDGQTSFQTTAATIGQALAQTGLQLYAADYVEPAIETPFKADLTVTYRPAQELAISVDGETVTAKSSAQTVGQALASAGIPLLGLDQSLPGESDPLPADGQIKIIRVTETVSLVEKSIPFSKKYEYSADLAVGSQKVLQVGEPGLMVSRVRVRYEDGVEVERTTEAETLVRPPKDSLVSLGTQVTVQTLEVPGGQIQYWRAVQMYATSYSPCRSGTSKCSYGTASGLPVKQGVVAMVRGLYNLLAGTQVYVPGYGVAVIGDVGGGLPDGRLWIDLGYSDDDWQNWGSMVTVYFLAPAPTTIPDILN
jgi:resuscitation-promoting factor RpfB